MVASGDSLAPASDMLKTKVAATGLTITITGDLAKRAMAVEKRARNICTNSSYSSFINSASGFPRIASMIPGSRSVRGRGGG